MNPDAPVSEMMTRHIVSVSPQQRLADLKDLFKEKQFHYNIPVIEGDELKGMVVLTDFMFAIKNDPDINRQHGYSDLQVKDIMRGQVQTVSPATTVREVAGIFSNGEVHTLMVTEQQQLLGIVSTADVIRWMIKEQQ